MLRKPGLRVKLEQFRQARRIHGGLLKLSVAVLGVRLARVPVPTRRLRESFYRFTFNKKYPPGLDESEAEKPLGEYRSLNALFTRGLKPACRPITAGTPQFLSPCDGTVQEIGRVEAGKILTLKGIEYKLSSLLPDSIHRRTRWPMPSFSCRPSIATGSSVPRMDARRNRSRSATGCWCILLPARRAPVYTLNEA